MSRFQLKLVSSKHYLLSFLLTDWLACDFCSEMNLNFFYHTPMFLDAPFWSSAYIYFLYLKLSIFLTKFWLVYFNPTISDVSLSWLKINHIECLISCAFLWNVKALTQVFSIEENTDYIAPFNLEFPSANLFCFQGRC